MFEGLTEKLGGVLRGLRGRGKLTEKNIEAALRQVRLALLEADVNYNVVKTFIAGVRERALGEEVLASITPGQQFTKIVRDELARVLGGESSALELKGSPAVVMMVGLQGSGKTTSAAKLAVYLKGLGRRVFMVPADLTRPAAVLQLKTLSEGAGIDCYDSAAADSADPAAICKDALRAARLGGYDTVLVDTAGRLHVQEDLVAELKGLKEVLKPSEVCFVADAMTGQDAVNTATSFDRDVGITSILLTKLDGDARGGAALSMRFVTGRPIKFSGVGERPDALEPFHPERLAGRILGMGDVVTLVEKAAEAIDENKARELEANIRKETFTLQDFGDQLRQLKRLGSLDGILSMIPGFDDLVRKKGVNVDEGELKRVEAIIGSMTLEERLKPSVLNARRRKRIAQGSGTKVQDVNRLLKQHVQMQKMMKKLKKLGPGGPGGPGGLGGLGGLFRA
jgi:signal recognition particle subunit SRP54